MDSKYFFGHSFDVAVTIATVESIAALVAAIAVVVDELKPLLLL